MMDAGVLRDLGEPGLRHDEGVTGTNGGQRLVQSGALPVGAGQALVHVDLVGRPVRELVCVGSRLQRWPTS